VQVDKVSSSQASCGGEWRVMGGARDQKDRAEYNESQELENLQRVFHILSHQKPGALTEKDAPKVNPDKLADALKKLQYKCKRTDVEDMIWEVDEDCDGMISWEEFKAMFYRVRHDKTGWEPRRLFNVVEFMMHDKDQSGNIDMDECMEILFRRFGKDHLEARVNEFMVNDEDGDKEISFTEFLAMDMKNDLAGTSKHPGFRLSSGMLQTTRDENKRLLRQMGVAK